MKVEPITKETFYRILGKKEGSVKFISKWFKSSCIPPFFESFEYFKTETGVFAYIPSLNRFLIPDVENKPEISNEDSVKEMELDLSNWEITRISEKSKYERGTFLLFDVFIRSSIHKGTSYRGDDKKPSAEKISPGDYKIKYKPESAEYSIGVDKEADYYSTPCLAIPEMLVFPMDQERIVNKINFLKEILEWKRTS